VEERPGGVVQAQSSRGSLDDAAPLEGLEDVGRREGHDGAEGVRGEREVEDREGFEERDGLGGDGVEDVIDGAARVSTREDLAKAPGGTSGGVDGLAELEGRVLGGSARGELVEVGRGHAAEDEGLVDELRDLGVGVAGDDPAGPSRVAGEGREDVAGGSRVGVVEVVEDDPIGAGLGAVEDCGEEGFGLVEEA
jgi:hypothetical protein